jgi:sugar lactone lactonase YvrE
VEVSVFDDAKMELGECPLWDERAGVLWWIDSLARWIYRRRMDDLQVEKWQMPSEIGSIALTEGNEIVVALSDGVHDFDPASGKLRLVARVAHGPAPEPIHIRLNDGKPDPAGRFVVGSIVVGSQEPLGALYSISAGTASTLHSGIGASNGVCFSPDGRTLYYADSFAQKVYAADYDVATGAAGPRRTFADLATIGAWPDGATIDRDGRLWVILANLGQLAVFSPAGSLERRVELGLRWPTCPTFGGPRLDTLFVTTLTRSHSIRSDHANAGRLLMVKGSGARGLPVARCKMI